MTAATLPKPAVITRKPAVVRRPRGRAAPYFFLAPYVILNLVFFLYPLIYASILAFYETDGPRSRAFVGWGNFSFVIKDPDFHRAFWNTTIFAVFSICLQLPLSLGLAMLLNAKNDRLKGIFRLAIFGQILSARSLLELFSLCCLLRTTGC